MHWGKGHVGVGLGGVFCGGVGVWEGGVVWVGAE